MKRVGLLWICFTTAVFVHANEPSPRFLSHLLGYIALDYSAAVASPGVVISEPEYSEMLEFVDWAIKESSGIPAVAEQPSFQVRLSELKEKIRAKVSPVEVARLARELESSVIRLCELRPSPTDFPSLSRGEKKYANDCASCHGITGHGDGPAGGSLDPRPANFHDDGRMSAITPFNIFNAIRLGVPGTAMAAFALSDDETWDLAFFVASLRHLPRATDQKTHPSIALADLAEKSDDELLARIDSPDKLGILASARSYQAPSSDSSRYVDVAVDLLAQAEQAFSEEKWDRAERNALAAYLDGVELFEPSLRAKNPGFVLELEGKMAAVRTVIVARGSRDQLRVALSEALAALEEARKLLDEFAPSPVMTAILSSTIVLREALEAVLILIALLGVVRSAQVPVARASIHAGWILALSAGFGLWFLSGWVVKLSGLQRELLEGFVTLFAVAVLLYFGFWLHRRTEIGRWRMYLNQIAVQLADGKKLFGLFGVAFMAVFREAFETVLFLRALSLESGRGASPWIAAGFGVAVLIAGGAAVIALRLSRRLPVRQLFLVSSTMLVCLAVILTGKALHAFQEAGLVGITAFPFSFTIEPFGVYPTWESLLPQILIVALALAVWSYDRWRSLLNTQVPQS